MKSTSRGNRRLLVGFVAGAVAGLAMTTVMLLLAWLFQVATPLVLLGDRLSVFITPKPFFWIMGKVGGYNHLKQLGVSSAALGQIAVGAFGGLFNAWLQGAESRRRPGQSLALFIVLPLVVSALILWPVLGTHYRGLPIESARLVTLLGLALSFFVFERVLVLASHYLTVADRQAIASDSEIRSQEGEDSVEYTPRMERRGFVLGAAGVVLAGGAAAIARRLYRSATFSYDGTQYRGAAVRPITPNDQFYCVTKNVIDPKVDGDLWHLEISGLVQNPHTYRLQDFKSMAQMDQETTLMCISNGLDAGLISNALWQGVPLSDLLQAAGPLAAATKVKLHGVDNYTDTFPLEKAIEPTTLVALKMNGEPLPNRHGFPARMIVPGYFGEKHVKWLTRIELARDDAKGFYEAQGWGPDFIVPTRSRIDLPANETWLKLTAANNGVALKGVAFGGDRGISRVEVSSDDGATWDEATIDYPGTKLTWALWSFTWQPEEAGDYTLVVRATDGEGEVQELEEDRAFTSGITGFHKVAAHIYV